MDHNLLSDRQRAFRKRYSCEAQAVAIIDNWASFWIEVER